MFAGSINSPRKEMADKNERSGNLAVINIRANVPISRFHPIQYVTFDVIISSDLSASGRRTQGTVGAQGQAVSGGRSREQAQELALRHIWLYCEVWQPGTYCGPLLGSFNSVSEKVFRLECLLPKAVSE